MMAEQLAETVDLQPGQSVLDVASGNGNAALAAARRFADVTTLDYVPMPEYRPTRHLLIPLPGVGSG